MVTRTIMPSTTRNNISNEPSPRSSQYPNIFRKSPRLRSKKGARSGLGGAYGPKVSSRRSVGWACLPSLNTPCRFLMLGPWGNHLPAHRRRLDYCKALPTARHHSAAPSPPCLCLPRADDPTIFRTLQFNFGRCSLSGHGGHSRNGRQCPLYVDVWDGFVDEAGKYSNYGPDYEGQMRRLRSSDSPLRMQRSSIAKDLWSSTRCNVHSLLPRCYGGCRNQNLKLPL
jgi:hypothetical protein